MRIIARLDIKNEFLIKGINLEGLRKIGIAKEERLSTTKTILMRWSILILLQAYTAEMQC